MSYRLARRTLLQPVRTEIFKAQMEQLQRVLKYFIGKNESTLRNDCGFDDLEAANLIKLYDDYVRIVFGVEIPEDGRPYDRAHCPESIMHIEDFLDDHELVTSPLKSPVDESEGVGKKGKEEWSRYRFNRMHIPQSRISFDGEMQTLISEPLLSKTCVALLNKYVEIVEKNADVVKAIIRDTINEMPTLYPDLEHMQNANMVWLHNKVNSNLTQLSPAAEEIILYARNHFGVEDAYVPVKNSRLHTGKIFAKAKTLQEKLYKVVGSGIHRLAVKRRVK